MPGWHPQRLRETLIGPWSLERHYTGTDGHMTGEADFTPQPDGALLYRETGLLRLGDSPAAEAYQNHIYRFDDAALTVSFKDGPRDGESYLILTLPAGAISGFTLADTYRCPPDRYEVRYRFDAPDSFQIETRVTGPAKAYTATGLYRRP